MEMLADNWPMLLIVMAVVMVVTGLIRRLIRLALIGVVLGAAALVLLPLV